MAEFFMNKGKDCLIIFDDLSKHSVAKREITRLLKMPAGRDAFPADSFYDHSKLLERAACVRKESGGGSITAIPIIETQDGDISQYIPTNVISITDGQIFLDKNRFNLQQRPAIDVGLSVSRIGSSAQSGSLRKVSKSMKGQISQYEELLKFAQFAATSLDNIQRNLIEKGRQLGLLLTQKENRQYSEAEEVLLIAGCHYGILSTVKDFNEADLAKEDFLNYVKANHNSLYESIKSTSSVSEEDLKTIEKFSASFIEEYTKGQNQSSMDKSSNNETKNNQISEEQEVV
jgi:F-type H+-transporting ATPase subunit alpha